MSATSLRQRGAIAAAVATALLVTACGGGSSSGAAAAGGSAAVTSAAAGATAPAAAPTSAASGAAPTSKIVIPSEAGVTTVKATGGGQFCKDLASAVNKAAATATGSSTATLKQTMEASNKVALQALALAPSKIKADVQTLVTASAALATVLAKDNYDYSKLTPADEAAIDTPQYTAAAKRVALFIQTDCGIDIGGGAAGASSS